LAMGSKLQIAEPSYQAYSTPLLGWQVGVGRPGPLARIRGEEGRDSKEGQDKVMRVSLVL
jgi:hypothetical protein